ncbi:prolyl endopeptidase FAP-like isoform X2 [Anneissia japonica]|uniref:prolyl endopeptidase FAP-like isoform X2 n=1 Tax=Anneissia japonica TaxID=1529436 RepID=UPI0014259F2E|nr:prolyl endopeptidase FAP-like isoform X2 [Anneissia japonica]
MRTYATIDGSGINKDSQSMGLLGWFQELVGGHQEQRNWKGIIISLLVIILICTIIIICILIVTPDESFYENYTFDDIFRNESFQIKKFKLSWLQEEGYDTTFIYQDVNGNIMIGNANSTPGYQVMDNRTLFGIEASMFWLSPRMETMAGTNTEFMYLLLACKVQRVFRHSFNAKYKVYKISLGNYNAGEGDEDGKFVMNVEVPGMLTDDSLQLVQWSPHGNSLVIVYKNNIYFKESVSNNDKAIPITSDGEDNQIFNGIPDWLYEEEILHGNSAIYWSTRNRFAYIQFNDTNVLLGWWPVYENNIYPKQRNVTYPKPGEINPTAKLFVVQDATQHNGPLEIKMPMESSLNFAEYYIQSVAWASTEELVVTWMNRPQNISLITRCNVGRQERGEVTCKKVEEQKSESGWVAQPPAPVFTTDKRSFVQIMPQNEGRDFRRFNHIVYFKQDNPFIRLTEGEYEVSKIYGIDSENIVYFASNKEGYGTKNIYSVQTSKPFSVKCLSCGTSCSGKCSKGCLGCEYFDATFNPSLTWLLLNCEGPSIPCSWIRQTRAIGGRAIEEYLVENNTALQKAIEGKGTPLKVPKKEFLTLKNEKDQDIHVQLIMPVNYDDKRKHPLLVNVYGGPGSQKVTKAFEMGWSMYLASKFHVITASIDGRGSGGKGEKFRHEIYKKFGTVEVRDQIDITKELLNTLPYLNPTKVAIFGWSYGGFVAASVAGSSSNVFNCSIAVAPVTDWRYYDSAYTERYMGDPLTNKDAYSKANVSAKASAFKEVQFLIVHGTADDNVHFQNSADLVRALVQEEVVHQTQFYPDQAHSLEDPHVQLHLYRLLTNFLRQCLSLDSTPPV